MAEPIIIHPVTRIEGHAKISIYIDDDGTVEGAQFHVTEFRGFERFCEGRPFHEMPGIMARICGICPVSHMLASAKAGDELLGVTVPAAAHKLRRLINYAQLLQSHALSFFHLSSPDLLLGMDSEPQKRSIFGLLEHDRDFARRGIRLRQYGQRIIELLGGQKVHPSFAIPGGVTRPLAPEQRKEILDGIPEALETMRIAVGRLKRVLDQFEEEINYVGNFPSLSLGLVTREGGLEYYDGVIRVVDAEGNLVADQLDARRYYTYLGEASEEWSYMKFPYYKALGYPHGMYRVGPLARINVATWAGTPLADRELREFRHRDAEARGQSFHYHLARLIEMLHAVERIEEIASDPESLDKNVLASAGLNRHEGVGVSEAPRGILFHHYEVDDDGLITKVNLLIATAQNNLAINKAVEQTAMRFVTPRTLEEGMLNRVEAAVRCYDPCLSCSTHAVGRMPMELELVDRRRGIVGRLRRDGEGRVHREIGEV